eukprot:scaffold5038_cov112-Isochrysis_galbana.AAC.6
MWRDRRAPSVRARSTAGSQPVVIFSTTICSSGFCIFFKIYYLAVCAHALSRALLCQGPAKCFCTCAMWSRERLRRGCETERAHLGRGGASIYTRLVTSRERQRAHGPARRHWHAQQLLLPWHAVAAVAVRTSGRTATATTAQQG